MNTPTSFQITVSAELELAFYAIIDRMAKLGKKLNTLAPGVRKVGNSAIKQGELLYPATVYEITNGTLTVEGNHKYVGKISHEDGMTSISEVPGFTINPTFRTRHHCDHCNKVRNRNSYFVFTHEERGELQVGSSCLKDFIGHNPQHLLGWLDGLAELHLLDNVGPSDENEGGGLRTAFGYEFNLTLATIVNQIRTRGFRSAKMVAEIEASNPLRTVTTTAEEVNGRLFDHYRRDEYRVACTPTEENYSEAAEFLTWAAARTGDVSTFWFNVVQQLENNAVFLPKKVSYVAAAVQMWIRENEAAKVRGETKVSEFVGAVGEKIEASITVTRINLFDTQFGTSRMIIGTTEAGAVLVWTTTSASVRDVEVGQTLKLSGAVKNHAVFRDIKQTVLTRCKVV